MSLRGRWFRRRRREEDLDEEIQGHLTMEQIISESLAERRFTMLLLIMFAAVALILAAIGIYGVMSYTVSRRTQEMGVRMALGAPRPAVLKMIVREGMILASIGIAAGLGAALALTRLMSNLLYAVRPSDPSTLAAVSLLLLCVSLLACYVPARRATKVDPLVALRYE